MPEHNNKKMRFTEFLEIHASLMPAVSFAAGSPAFIDLLRSWNTLAILFPDRCADVIVWGKGDMPSVLANDIDVEQLRATLGSRPLENLPTELRPRPVEANASDATKRPVMPAATSALAEATAASCNDAPVAAEVSEDGETIYVPNARNKPPRKS